MSSVLCASSGAGVLADISVQMSERFTDIIPACPAFPPACLPSARFPPHSHNRPRRPQIRPRKAHQVMGEEQLDGRVLYNCDSLPIDALVRSAAIVVEDTKWELSVSTKEQSIAQIYRLFLDFLDSHPSQHRNACSVTSWPFQSRFSSSGLIDMYIRDETVFSCCPR